VIARWLDAPLRAWERSGPRSAGILRGTLTNRWKPPPNTSHAARSWVSKRPELVTTSLCRRCNNEWLNQIETAARPHLEPMITGQPVVLDSDAQRAVALWAYKTALLMQLLRPADVRVIPNERYTALYAYGRPPTDAWIWLGAVQGGPAMSEALTDTKMTSPSGATPAWFSAIALGSLLLACAGRLAMTDEPLRMSAKAEGSTLVPVWPASLHRVAWPPADVLTGLNFDDLTDLGTLF
jgi:hypothetical protein